MQFHYIPMEELQNAQRRHVSTLMNEGVSEVAAVLYSDQLTQYLLTVLVGVAGLGMAFRCQGFWITADEPDVWNVRLDGRDYQFRHEEFTPENVIRKIDTQQGSGVSVLRNA